MRVWLACLLLFVSLLGCRSVAAGDAGLSDLKQWVGKYPSDKIDGKTVWDNATLKAMISKMLDPETVKLFYDDTAAGVSSIIESQDSLLKVFVCRAHDCIYHSATMFVDLKKEKLSICWVNVFDEQDAWLQLGQKPRVLPRAECLNHEGFGAYKTFHKD